MGRPRNRPRNLTILQTYAELTPYTQAFAQGKLNLLFLIGEAGLQKSRLMREAVGETALWLEGHITPFRMYLELYQHRQELVVIDDADSLTGDPAGVRLLKCLCQTETRKTVSWHSNARQLQQADVPTSFETHNRVCIIANTWKTLNANVAALEDRGHLLLFQPTAEEIHRQTAAWFDDQEVFEFIAEHLHLIAQPSMRQYRQAQELKAAGVDWREELRKRWLPPRRRLVARLKADTSLANEEERVRLFVEQGGGSRATYFRCAKRIQRSGEPLRIVLREGEATAGSSGNP